jgi:uncharacterized protein (TIGR03067 family)
MCVALSVSLAAGVPAGGQDKVGTTGDRQRLAGAWKAVSLESEGRPQGKAAYVNTTMTFEGDAVSLAEQGYAPVVMRFKLDPAASPKSIDLILQDGPRKGETMAGIYELSGDELRICLRIGRPGRPTAFQTRAGDNNELFTLRRAQAGSPWKRFTAEADGYSIEFPGEPEARKRRTGPAARPVDLTIYVVRNDQDRVSFLAMGQRLPARLTTEFDATTVLQASLEGLLEGFRGEVVRERKLNVPSGAGGEYVLRSTEGVQAVARIYVRGDRAFVLQVVGKDDPAGSADAERFLGSFRMSDE